MGTERQVMGSGERQEVGGQVGIACAEEFPDVWKGKVEDREEESMVTAQGPFGVDFVKELCEVQPSLVEVSAGGELGDLGEGRLEIAKFRPDGVEVVAREVGVEGVAVSAAVVGGFEEAKEEEGVVDEDGGGGVEVGDIGSEGLLIEGVKGRKDFDEGRSGGEGCGREGSIAESRDDVGG